MPDETCEAPAGAAAPVKRDASTAETALVLVPSISTSQSAAPAPPAAAISVVGPTTRILGLRRDFIVASVCRAAQRVSTLIGVVHETQH